MDGRKDNSFYQGSYFNRRKVVLAAEGIFTYSPQGFGWLEYYGDGDVVLAPVVSSHDTGHREYYANFGWIRFDCKMDISVSPSEVIMLTGPAGAHLLEVGWLNDYTIEYYIPPLQSACWIDFLVDPENAVSYHNESQLDGNTNPPIPAYQNGVGPNQDHFNWTSSHYIYRFADFENGVHNQLIKTTIPGLDFSEASTPYTYYWRYKQPTANSNVYPYCYSSSTNYPIYWFDGCFAAWIGEESAYPYQITAPISFTHGTASMVCFGYTSYAHLYVMAYNAENDSLLEDPVRLSPHRIYESIPSSHSIRQVIIAPDESHVGERISYITIRGTHNTFGIDNLVVYDFLFEGFGYLLSGYDPVLQKIEKVEPGGAAVTHTIEVDDVMDSLRVICYWNGGENEGTRLELRNPTGTLVFEEETNKSPILVSVIANPMEGDWKICISALQQDGKA